MRLLVAFVGLLMLMAPPALAQDQPERDICTPGPRAAELATGTNCRNLTIDGVVRDYFVVLPYPRPTEPRPVVFVFHDAAVADFSLFMRISGWTPMAEEDGIILIFPHALPYATRTEEGTVWQTRWHGFGLDERIDPSIRLDGLDPGAAWPADDVAFIDAILAALADEAEIDRSRIYAVGYGDGGAFAARLAYERANMIAAIATIGAPLGLGLPEGLAPASRTVPIFAVLGADDEVVAAAYRLAGIPFDRAELVQWFDPLLAVFGFASPPCVTADDDAALTITFCGAASGEERLVFMLVEGLAHGIPTLLNNPADFTLPRPALAFFRGYMAPGGAP